MRLNSACFLICFHSGLSKLNLLIKVEKLNAEHYWRDANCVSVEIGKGGGGGTGVLRAQEYQ